jgi:hypothetical protein
MLYRLIAQQFARRVRQDSVAFNGFVSMEVSSRPYCGVALVVWADLGRRVRPKMNEMLAGAIATASMVAGLFFRRFWKSTRDRFSLYFSMSSFIEGVNRFLFGSMVGLREEAPAYYLIRLVAYGLILVAILDKNQPVRKNQ